MVPASYLVASVRYEFRLLYAVTNPSSADLKTEVSGETVISDVVPEAVPSLSVMLTPDTMLVKVLLDDVTGMLLFTVTWAFSPIKFQADMGILLAFMFLVNAIAAIVLLPALVAWMRPACPNRP